jgi:predicted  nucleic acid-binding Zn-ribbon protein
MACMEHRCTNLQCDWIYMDNTNGPDTCPKCGAKVIHDFDEHPEPLMGDVDAEIADPLSAEED